MRRTLVLLATLLLATTLTSQAVYFYLADTSKSCFLQEGTLLLYRQYQLG